MENVSRETEWEIVDIGIDWISATAGNASVNAQILEAIARNYQTEKESEGATGKTQQWQQFKGKTVGGMFFGRSDDMVSIQAGSSVAKILAKELKAYAPTATIGRLDTQITARRQGAGESFVKAFYEEHEANAHKNSRGRQISGSYRWSGDCGATFAIGARTSHCFSRIYNKSAQSRNKVEKDLIRFENERHKRAARSVWADYCTIDDETEFVKNVVMKTLRNQGAPIDFLAECQDVDIQLGKQLSDIEVYSEWFKRSIKPSLVRRAENGHKETIAALLLEVIDELRFV
jgi:hypothetical protein